MLTILPYTHVTTIGSYQITDSSKSVAQYPCGEVLMNLDELQGYERRAAAYLLRIGGNLLCGELYRYARKALGHTYSELADILGSSADWISGIEGNWHKYSNCQRLAIIALLEEDMAVSSYKEMNFSKNG